MTQRTRHAKPVLTDDEKNALIRRAHISDAVKTAAIRDDAEVATAGADDPDKLFVADLQQLFGRNPKYLKRAKQLFPALFDNPETSWWVFSVALDYARAKDNDAAKKTFDKAIAQNWGTQRIKESITELNRNGRAPAAPREKKADTLAEQVKQAITEWGNDNYKLDLLESELDDLARRIVTALTARRAKEQTK